MPLTDGPIGTRDTDTAARDHGARGAACSRGPCAPADPLPHGLDDVRVLAVLILRQVRANRGMANAAGQVMRSPSSATRSHPVRETRAGRPGHADRRHPIDEGGVSGPVHILLAELAGRRVHEVTMTLEGPG